jgi:hypothetical protein
MYRVVGSCMYRVVGGCMYRVVGGCTYRVVGGCVHPAGNLGLMQNKEQTVRSVVTCHSNYSCVTNCCIFSMARQPPSAEASSLSRVRVHTNTG